jgi:putative transposase
MRFFELLNAEGVGGGALIVDKFGEPDQEREKLRGTGRLCVAAEVVTGTA